MGRVYTSASTVLAFLGNGSSEDLSAGFDLLVSGSPSRLDSKASRSLQQLFGQPYFGRVWVIQEISNARAAQLHYNRWCVGWSLVDGQRLRELQLLGMAPSWVYQLYGASENHPENITQRIARVWNAAEPPPILLISS
jgi:hypothetical protein